MDILLPPLAEGADSGTVVSILVKVGDVIKADQSVIEIENEKAIAPIPSTSAGTVTEIYVAEGDTVSVGQKLVAVGEGGAAAKDKSAAKSEAPKKKTSQSKSAPAAKKSVRTDVVLPALAEGADSGTVVSIMVKAGDAIEKDQPLIEIENEKAIAPIPSTVAGVVAEVYVNEGDVINEGQKLVAISSGDGSAPAVTQEREAAPSPIHTPYDGQKVEDPYLSYRYQSRSGYPPPASPSIRKMSAQIGLDLSRVPGSGHGGRILIEDIQTYIQYLQNLADSPRQAAPAASSAPSAAPSKPKAESIDFSQWGKVKSEPISSLRKTIGRRLQDAWNTIPHVYQFDEADISDVMELRKKYKAAYAKKDASLTLTSVTIKAVVKALKDYPIFNASLDEVKHEIVYKEYFHIGVAVDTEAGLVVPVIRDADKKSILDISLELQELAAKARDRKLSSEEMKGSSFTISNLGGIGGTHFTPIVNPPNTAILGVGRGAVKPVYDGKKFIPRSFMSLCVSYDHRVIDGADGARFITSLVEAIETFPESEIKLSSSQKK
ncbi:MAG: 2-oxo acid dehydrogenase subunit E2 [Candidatus Hinthialibacter antarcticus]|nr:2-oxo acid dehydrogenase subunit E2 [Candidatus Hinthialibacter antarcticus]